MTNSNPKKINIDNITSTLGKFHLEANRCARGMSIMISGVIGVSSFTESEIILKSHSGRIRVDGRILEIKVYENGTAEICGRVENIGFLYGKN